MLASVVALLLRSLDREGVPHMTTAPAQHAPTRQGLLARRPLVSFFVMAYAFSWLVWSPWVLGQDGVGLLPFKIGRASGVLLAAGIIAGPTLSAFIMTATTEGRAGVRRLLGRLVLWRVGIRWYLFALLGVPLIILVGTMIYTRELPNLKALGGPSYLLSYLGTYALVVVLGGPLFEEIGWRGFALPRMEPLHGPLLAAVILGLLWALWHLPEFLVPSWAASSGAASLGGKILFALTAIMFSIVTTWVFNNTKASVLLAILVHASIDAFTIPLGAMFPAGELSGAIPFTGVVAFGVVAVVLIVLTRGRLSYERLVEAQSAPRVR
jgi:uncharacterized protein